MTGRWNVHKIPNPLPSSPKPGQASVDMSSPADTPPASPIFVSPLSMRIEEQEAQPILREVGSEAVSDTIAKRLAGQLEISVAWDRSHDIFLGLRTVIVFKASG